MPGQCANELAHRSFTGDYSLLRNGPRRIVKFGPKFLETILEKVIGNLIFNLMVEAAKQLEYLLMF